MFLLGSQKLFLLQLLLWPNKYLFPSTAKPTDSVFSMRASRSHRLRDRSILSDMPQVISHWAYHEEAWPTLRGFCAAHEFREVTSLMTSISSKRLPERGFTSAAASSSSNCALFRSLIEHERVQLRNALSFPASALVFKTFLPQCQN